MTDLFAEWLRRVLPSGTRHVPLGGGVTCGTCGHYFKLWYRDAMPAELAESMCALAAEEPEHFVVVSPDGAPIVACPGCGTAMNVPTSAERFAAFYSEGHERDEEVP